MSRARTFADLATASEAGSLTSPNIIINGDMSVAQRGTSSTGQSSSGVKTIDQWTYIHSGGGTVDISQSTTVPTGFKNSYKIECNAADGSLGATEISGLRCYIEAQHCQKLLYGTSSAKTITLSFHVRSKQTGTYAVNVFSDDSTRQFTKTYTISSADTFEKKTITFAGDTSGAINDDNGKGIEFTWWLRAGSTYTGYISYNGGFTDVSDRREKDNIETITGATEKVKQLRGVTHTWVDNRDDGLTHYGLIAQEVREVIPEVVTETATKEGETEPTLGVEYQKLVPLLIETIKELEARIETLENA